jgi:diguanylate cyclase (GGDEF)-like protein
MEQHQPSNPHLPEFVLDSLLDSMHAILYITDPATDEIIYMSRNMKESYGLAHPEGKTCWQILQKDMDGRCPFCPVERLLQSDEPNPSVIWEEHSSLTGRTYENYDSLIYWIDGRRVHLQHSLDITEWKQLTQVASQDELTGLMNRRAGMLLFRQRLDHAYAGGPPLCVCLFDLDGLKQINDRYGHREGDRVIRHMAAAVKQALQEGEFLFRLSGDEFVLLLPLSLPLATQRVQFLHNHLLRQWDVTGIPYEVTFSYGLAQALPETRPTQEDLLVTADEQMYQQKRLNHIRAAKAKLQQQSKLPQDELAQFSYDGDRLYDALIRSTDDYIYQGNVKTGTFRYPPDMVQEFDLPGEIVPNAAAVWGQLVHPDDQQIFLESNQEVTDGRVDSHYVEYRAKNRYGQWVWLRCRGYLERDDQGQPDFFAGIITNLGRRNRIDSVSGLHNVLQFEEDLRKLIATQGPKPLGMMLLSMDHIEEINQRFGHAFGNEAIRMVGQRLHSILPSRAALYRMDGNQMGILIRELREGDFQQLGHRVQAAFRHQQEVEGRYFRLSFTAGCAASGPDSGSYQELLRRCHAALTAAREAGPGQMRRYPAIPL